MNRRQNSSRHRVARVGNHGSAFFVGPETPGSPGVELAADDTETPVTAYKGRRVKRQAARFRVFEYDEDAAGNLRLVGEPGGTEPLAPRPPSTISLPSWSVSPR